MPVMETWYVIFPQSMVLSITAPGVFCVLNMCGFWGGKSCVYIYSAPYVHAQSLCMSGREQVGVWGGSGSQLNM